MTNNNDTLGLGELAYTEVSENVVNVFRRSPLTGEVNSMEIPISRAQLQAFCGDGGETLIQQLLPTCNDSQREFLKTGYTPEDWEAMFFDHEK